MHAFLQGQNVLALRPPPQYPGRDRRSLAGGHIRSRHPIIRPDHLGLGSPSTALIQAMGLDVIVRVARVQDIRDRIAVVPVGPDVEFFQVPLGKGHTDTELAVGREQFRARNEVKLLATWLARDFIAGSAIVVEVRGLEWDPADVEMPLPRWRALTVAVDDLCKLDRPPNKILRQRRLRLEMPILWRLQRKAETIRIDL